MTILRSAITILPPEATRLLSGWALGRAAGTDVELLEAARGGDREAISQLVERYSPRLLRYLRRMAGEVDAADDLLQDTWLRVVERLDQHRKGRPFAPWLFSVAHNCAIDWMRRRRGQPQFATAYEDEAGEREHPLDRVASGERSALDALSEEALYERVALLLPALPPRYREVLSLRFEEEMTLKEVAVVVGVPISTVKTRARRGLALLRRRLEGE